MHVAKHWGSTSGGAKRGSYATSAPQGRVTPAFCGGPLRSKEESQAQERIAAKRDAPPGARQCVDGLSRSVSHRQRARNTGVPLPITTASLRGRHAHVAKLQHAKARLPMTRTWV